MGRFRLWVPRPSPTMDLRLSGLQGLRPVLESLEFWKGGRQQGLGLGQRAGNLFSNLPGLLFLPQFLRDPVVKCLVS